MVMWRACEFRKRAKRARSAQVAALLVLSLNSATTIAFQVSGPSWPKPTTTFHVAIPGSNGSVNWNDAFEIAMARWSTLTEFKFVIQRNSFADPCADPNVPPLKNGVKFSDTSCGTAFGSTTLAYTQYWYRGGELLQAGVIFNEAERWNVHSGPQAPWGGVNDFTRVAVHELGHALGLTHEQQIPAIMAATIGDIEYPVADDIAGVAYLYRDTDGDSLYDRYDNDDDNDGIADAADNCPRTANPTQTDTDRDGAGDACDTDDDGDGVADVNDAFPLDASRSRDSDHDGIEDSADRCPNDPTNDCEDLCFPIKSAGGNVAMICL